MIINGYKAMKFHGRKTDCRVCEARAKCLKYPDTNRSPSGVLFSGAGDETERTTFTERMKQKIDSIKGRLIYNRRLGTAEPPFAHISQYWDWIDLPSEENER